MPHTFSITADPHPAEHTVTLLLNGRISADALPELASSIARARGLAPQVQIDLSEVTLVDRQAAAFISAQASHHIELVNCPAYLRRWLAGSCK